MNRPALPMPPACATLTVRGAAGGAAGAGAGALAAGGAGAAALLAAAGAAGAVLPGALAAGARAEEPPAQPASRATVTRLAVMPRQRLRGGAGRLGAPVRCFTRPS